MPIIPSVRIGKVATEAAEDQRVDEMLAEMKSESAARVKGLDERIAGLDRANKEFAGEPPAPGMPTRRQAGESDAGVPNYTRAFERPEDVPLDEPATIGEDVGGPQEATGLTDADVIELQEYRNSRKRADTRAMLLEPGTPDQAAEDHRLADQAGVQPVQVEQDRDTFKAEERAKEIDALEFKAPKVRSWISDPANFRIAHDDTENLSMWEQIGKALDPGSISLDESKQALQVGTDQAAQGALGLEEIGIDIADFVTGWMPGVKGNVDYAGAKNVVTATRQRLARNALANTPRGDTIIEKGVYDALQSAPASVGALLTTLLTRSPAMGAITMGEVTGGQAFGDAGDAGKDMLGRLRYAFTQGGIEAATEFLPLKFLVGDLAKEAPFFKTLMKQAAAEGIGEQVATFTQDASTWLELNPDKTLGEFLKERPEAAIRTLIASTLMSGVQTTIAKGADKALVSLDQAEQQRRAETLERTFKAMADGAKDSKLLTRLPDKFREAVASVTKDGPLESVRITSEALNEFAQSNNLTPEQLSQAFRIDPDELISAIQSGEDVVIPAGNYAAALGTAKKELGISGEAVHTALAPNMRLRADDFTAKEHEAMQKVFEEEQRARVETGTKEQSFADSADRVRETIREQVANTKLFNTETANTQAAIAGEMVTTLAERTGQDPEVLWKEMGFDVVSALNGDDVNALPQARKPAPPSDEEILRASQNLTDIEFEAWKLASAGMGTRDIAVEMDETGEMTVDAVKSALRRAEAQGFVAPRSTVNDRSPQTQRVIDLAARGVKRGDIARTVFAGRPQTKASNQVGVLLNRHRDEIETKRTQLADALAQGDMRGSFTPRADRSIIRLFESANLSTFVHEASHWYLDTLWKMAQTEAPHPFVQEQLAAILEWKGKSPSWTNMFDENGRVTEEGRELHESFAETFEAYLREGKAPTTSLRSVFATLKQWLLNIYKSLSQIGRRVNLNDEIRAVFDRMLATDEAIKAATASSTRDSTAMAQALLEKGVITPKAFERTKARLQAAREQAAADLMARLMDDYERNQKAWWRSEERQVRAEVTSDVDERPEQRAYQWLSGGGWRGTQADQVEAALAEAEAMDSLSQFDEVKQFLRYFEPDATTENIKALRTRMLEDGVVPVILLFRTSTGRVIAFLGENGSQGWHHDIARTIMGLGNMKLDHGVYNPWKWPTLEAMNEAGETAWYATTGSEDEVSPEAGANALGQFMPSSAVKAPLHKLYDAIAMRARGIGKAQVWKDTGWAQTLDGEWVYEIAGEPQWAIPILPSQPTWGMLPDVIHWPELFEAMPVLRLVLVKLGIGKQSGNFNPSEDVRFVDGSVRPAMLIKATGAISSSNTLMETLRHEIQHVIQFVGGMKSQGANVNVKQFKGTPEFEREVAFIREMEVKFNERADVPTDQKMDLLSDSDVEGAAAFRIYVRNRGEVQAMDVEQRSRWTQSLRELLPPYTLNTGQEAPALDQTWATLDDLRADNLERHDVLPEGARPAEVGGNSVTNWIRPPYEGDRQSVRDGEGGSDAEAASGRGGNSLDPGADNQLAQLSRRGISALDKFMRGQQINGHMQIDNYEVYLRKATRPDENGAMVRTLDLASITRSDPNDADFTKGLNTNEKPGDFRELVQRMERAAAEYGLDGVFVENVMNEFLPDVLERYGYTKIPSGWKGAPSFIKHVPPYLAQGNSNDSDAKARTSPPPSLPPMRLNLEAVREQYGEEALARLPPEVRAYSAAATDADQFLEIARDVRAALKRKKPKADDVVGLRNRDWADQWEKWFDQQAIDINEKDQAVLRAQIETALTSDIENTIGPDEAAPFFNMPDGNALLQGLREGPKRAAIIKQLTDQRMIARHGDPFKDGTIMQEAERFARNEVQQRQYEIELEALAKAAGQFAASNLAKQTAQENLRSKQVREVLNYNQWLILEQRWGRKALEAAEKGKFDDAARFKRFQLINLAMFREGRKLAEDIEKARKHLLDYGSKTKQQRLTTAGEDYRDQMNGLLADYQLRPESKPQEGRRQARAQWIQAQLAGIDPFAAYQDQTKSPEEQQVAAAEALERSQTLANLAEGADARNYKSLTVEELMGVRDEADMIFKLATLKDRLIREGERRRVTLAAGDIGDEVRTNQPNPKPPPKIESEAPGEKAGRRVLQYFAMHRTLQSIARQFAGGKDNGVFWNYIVRPLNEAFARLATIRKQMGEDMKGLFSAYTPAEIGRFYKDRQHFASINQSLTKQGRLAVALNWGNEKNRKRLMDSTGWDQAGIQEVLNTLDKRDWDFIQAMWDYLDTWFPEANRVHENVHAAPMSKEAPLEIATRFGIYRGGYFPIKFDSNLSSKSAQRQLEKEGQTYGGRVGTRTKEGFTKSRVKGKVTLPLKLSVIDVISQHLDEVATSIATEEALFDAGRLVMHRQVEDAIVERHGRETYKEIIEVLRSAKFGMETGRNVIDHTLNHLRNGATVVGLGWKVATALLQPFGVSNSVVRVGGVWMAKGYARMGKDAVTLQASAKWIMDRSEFMASRRQSQSPEISALRAAVKGSKSPRWLVESTYWLMANVQFYSVDMPTWYGAYFKAQAAGLDEGDAIALADQAVVDAQGGGELHQTAGIQRANAAVRLLTNFMSYQITTYNLAMQRVRNTRTPLQAAALGLDMILLLSIPVAATMMLKAWTSGGGDDDDDLWDNFAREQIAFLLSPFAGISQIAGAFRGDDAFTYRGPAGFGFFGEAFSASKAAAEGDFDASFWRPANKAAGMALHYPAAQVDLTFRGALAMWNGETTDPKVLFFGPPPAN